MWPLRRRAPPPDPDAPQRSSFARELLTLRVRTIYAQSPRSDFGEGSNRLRLFTLSRLYADYLDGLTGEPTPRDLYGGLTTFRELAAQARGLLEAHADAPGGTLNPAQAEVTERVERTCNRLVREVFHMRRRAWVERLGGPEPGASDAQPDAEPTAHTPRGARALTLDTLSAPRAVAPASAAPDDDDDDEGGPGAVVPMMFVEFGDEIPEHEDPTHDLPPPDPEWLRRLFAANLHWDNELFSDGQTVLTGVDPSLLPPQLQGSRRYPPIELPQRTELALISALELGTDLVALQTALTLSGDVVTRISPHLPEADRELFLALHRDGTANALAYWTQLIQAAQAFLSGLFDTAFGDRA